MADPRKRVFVDRRVQGALLARILFYWLLTLLTTGAVLIVWNLAKGPVGPIFDPYRWEPFREQFSAVIAASVLLLPVLVVDTILFTSRIAGPVLRVRRSLRDLAAGKNVAPVDFRSKDLWPEMATDFNALVVYVNTLKTDFSRAPASHQPPEEAAEVGSAAPTEYNWK